MKTILNSIFITAAAGLFLTSAVSCSDYLEVTPENSQVADDYWRSEADVENMLFGGYFYLRSSVESYLIPWGETRAGIVYNHRSNNVLQRWQMVSTNSLCNWTVFYQIINVANTVLERAAVAQANDDTYSEASLKSHYSEAYFLRALAYFYLVRNFRDVPMPLTAYSDDNVEVNLPQTLEADVISQIKTDLYAALATGASKESYETNWETKGRATRWAIYALLADVCLWNDDYEECIQYCNGILNSNSIKAPAFLSSPTRNSFMSIFNPGNSNESIFELQWNYEEDQTNNLPTLFYDDVAVGTYAVSEAAATEFISEYQAITGDYGDGDISSGMNESARTYYANFVPNNSAGTGFVWKYVGSTSKTTRRPAANYDPNFIIYRVADVILMKAEALLCVDGNEPTSEHKLEAVTLINKIRERAGWSAENNIAGDFYNDPDMREDALDEMDIYSQEELLEAVLNERKMEFLGEGKIWYDFLRMGRRNNNQYKQTLLCDQVIQYTRSGSASSSWLRSVLNSDNALFLPVNASDLERNPNLVQNPYYN